jgi:hypothetical protein
MDAFVLTSCKVPGVVPVWNDGEVANSYSRAAADEGWLVFGKETSDRARGKKSVIKNVRWKKFLMFQIFGFSGSDLISAPRVAVCYDGAISVGVLKFCGGSSSVFDRMPNFDGGVSTREKRRTSSEKRGYYFRLLVLKSAALRGSLIKKMCGGIVGERTGLVKVLDERTTLVWGSFYRCQAADCGLSSGGV